MSPRVCICCGEPKPEKPNGFSGNPNLCAACEQLAAGLVAPTEIEFTDHQPGSLAVHEKSAEIQTRSGFHAEALQPASLEAHKEYTPD
jgi:hypothetical protein